MWYNFRMEAIEQEDLIMQVRQYAMEGWKLGRIHGVSHWDRVRRNGILLAEEGTNLLVVNLFAYLHDKCRIADGADIKHGERSAKLVLQLRDSLLKSLTDEEIHLLSEACRLHTVCDRTGDPTIDVCFDADRLDLPRVGITPVPHKMATRRGADFARYPEKFNRACKN